jgi:hypothetical protein
MPDLTLLPAALRELGLPTLLHFAAYQLSLRSGWVRLRTPARPWSARPLQDWAPSQGVDEAGLRARRPFFFDPDSDLSAGLTAVLHGGQSDLRREADAILRGEFRLFGADPRPLGFPPSWNSPPGDPDLRGAGSPRADRHWAAYDLECEIDLRSVWELSRLGWIFPLARAYRLSGEARYWEGCWSLLDAWRAANPPNAGPQWISAQEAGLRILALSFAWQAFAPELRRQPERSAAVLELVAACAARIPPTLSYARAQRNNHLLSEAVGLYTAGTLFPALREARRWRRLGSRWLGLALADQVFPDGGYIQHSINYHRLALSLGLWAFCLGLAQGEPLPPESRSALERLARSMAAVVEPTTGTAPRLGHDDGSLALPLSLCAYGDQRPVLQAAWRALFGEAAFPAGPWDELGFWLGLQPEGANDGTRLPAQPFPGADLPDAGLYVLGSRQAWAVLRCARFRSRPAHSDQLHLDLWRHGRNVALDPGSYLYAAPAPWDNVLARAGAHNGPVAEGHEPMRRAGRFLWLEWAQGTLIGRWRAASGALEAMAAEHDGYRRSKGWRCLRSVVRAGEDLWLVVDQLEGGGAQPLRLNWTLPDLPCELTGLQLRLGDLQEGFRLRIGPEAAEVGVYRAGELRQGAAIASAQEASTLGWVSPSYATLEPAITLLIKLAGSLPMRLETWWLFGQARPEDLGVEWSAPGSGPLPMAQVSWKGEELRLEGR